jgi:hypothetical protein
MAKTEDGLGKVKSFAKAVKCYWGNMQSTVIIGE